MLVKWLLLLGIGGNFTNTHLSSIHPSIHPSFFLHSFNILTAFCCAPSGASVTKPDSTQSSRTEFHGLPELKAILPLVCLFWEGSGRGKGELWSERAWESSLRDWRPTIFHSLLTFWV